MQPILSDWVFTVVPLTLTTHSVLQSFPVSHLGEIPVSTSHTGTWVRKEHYFSNLIPELKPRVWGNVQIQEYKRFTGHGYSYFTVFCGLKGVNLCTWCLPIYSHGDIGLQCYLPLCIALILFILQQWLKATAQCKFFTNKYRSDSACLNSWIFGRCPNEVHVFESESIKLK